MKKTILIALIIAIIIISLFVYFRFIRRPVITKEYIEQRFSQLRQAYQEKLDRGYDLTEVLNYGKQALEAYNRGDFKLANQLLDQALDALKRSNIPPGPPPKQCPICSLPSEWSECKDGKQTRTNYQCSAETDYKCQTYIEERSCESEIIKSNSWIMDPVTIEDEKPKVDYGDRQWWGFEGYTYTENKADELLLNANLYPLASVLRGFAYTLNGDVYVHDFTSFNWNDTVLYGNMIRENDDKIGTWSLKFPQDGYRVYELKVGKDILKVESWSSGVPLWGAKTESQMLQIGWANSIPIYGAGFHVVIRIKATLTKDGQNKIFNGWGKMEHIWIRPRHQIQGEAAVGFINQQPEFYINFFHLRNPYDLTEDFVKGGRIGFPDKAYRFDNFVYVDDYTILKNFELQGTFDDGRVDLTGERVGWVYQPQLHPLIRWTGTITRNGETINVNSLGSGEFRRLKSR